MLASAPLGLVQRNIGEAQSIVRIALGKILGPKHSDGSPNLDAVAVDHEISRAPGNDASADIFGVFDRCRLEDDAELVAAEPGHHGSRRHFLADRFVDRLQKMVAGPVAERIVDGLEAIEIEEPERKSPVCSMDLRVQRLLEGKPVRCAGQEVVECGVPGPGFAFRQLVDLFAQHLDLAGIDIPAARQGNRHLLDFVGGKRLGDIENLVGRPGDERYVGDIMV